MSEIQKTSDYSIFKKHHSNRDIDNANLKKLTYSIQARNLLQYRPILVDSEMRIIDGQHRLQAAKMLGLEVFYQIQQECTHEDIVILNHHQKGWKIEDYINYYISLGNQDYMSFKRLSQQLKATYNFIIRSMDCDNSYEKIRNGTFKYFSTKSVFELQIAFERSEEIKKMLDVILLKNKTFIKTERFSVSLCSFLKQENVDYETFLSKLRIKSDSLKICSNLSSYFEMFLNIYNWRNQSPVEIKKLY